MADDMKMLDRSVRHPQPMLEIKRLFVRRGPVNRLLHQGEIVRMHPIEHHFDGDIRRGLIAEDSEGLFRPEDLPPGHVPAEAAGVAELLCLCEISLAALQLLVGCGEF